MTPTTNTDAIRSKLTGVLLALFDVLLHAGLVDDAALWEGLGTYDTSAPPAQKRGQIARYARRLNARLASSGWRVVRIGRSAYELQRVSRPAADDDLHRHVASIEARVLEGFVPFSPFARKIGRDFQAACRVPAMTVEGLYARDGLRDLSTFQTRLDLARLRRAGIRDFGVFL